MQQAAWRAFVIVLTMLAPVSIGTALAQSEGPLGPLTSQVKLGTDGPWQASIEGSRFYLRNRADPGASRFYAMAIPDDRGASGALAISVNVGVSDSEDASGAGLIFGLNRARNSFFSFVLLGNKRVGLFRRDLMGYRLVQMAKEVAIKGDGTDRLTVQLQGRSAKLAINGSEVLVWETGDVSSGEAGVIASGNGVFSFEKFALGDAAVGQGPNAPDRQDLDPRVLGMTLGIFLHELGHGVIGELQLPATGPEEDVADEFASIVFVFNMRADARFRDLALWSARLWRAYALESAKQGGVHPWYDEHAPDMIRYGKILCTLAGADPENFADEIKKSVPEPARPRFLAVCKNAFEKHWRAWDTLLKAHRRNIDAQLPGSLPSDAKGGTMTVNYEWLDNPFISPFAKRFGPVLRDSKIFDHLAENLTRYYVLPRDVTVYFRDCDTFNAWYSADAGAITMCFNWIEDYFRLASMGELSEGPRPVGPRPRPRMDSSD